MSAQGTAAISLSAIAREMELSVPALYRYFTSRDALITVLIVEAYEDLADTMEQAAHTAPQDAYGDRLLAVMLAYRAWARQRPVDFQLIFGNPIPGYHAPAELTVPAARRSLKVVTDILSEAYHAKANRPPPQPESAAPPFSIELPEVQGGEIDLPSDLAYRCIAGWAAMHGLVMLELFNHLPMVKGDFGAFFRRQMVDVLENLGLNVTQRE